MSDHQHAGHAAGHHSGGHAGGHAAGHAGHGDSHYIRVYFILLALLTVSILGPMAEIKVLTLITAFGIAVVKAYLVAKNFMHINLTPRFVIYAITTTLVFMLLFFAGTAPDVMKAHGTNWEKPAWIAAEKAYAAGDIAGASMGAAIQGHGESHGEGHGEGHSEAPAEGHGEGHESGGH
ncbi:cytochrome C oxidase subunit IV family protein [Myxococcota bacterium]|nr:cytochrome C oxidase subunit IV family protein [Myxococcota bacterium]